jgi:proteic killer suppression protein
MIRNFKHKGLALFFSASDHRAVPGRYVSKIKYILDALDEARKPFEMDIKGCGFHELKGDRKATYAVIVSRNWRITFKVDGEDAIDVHLEDYH